jgi:hypothetical protein
MADSQTHWGAWAALALTLLAAGLVIALHFLSPEFIPLRFSLSQYAHGSYSLLFLLAVLAFAIGIGALAYSLVVEFSPDASHKFGAFLLILAAFSLAFAAFFPADPGDAAATMTGQIHAWSLRSGITVVLLASLLSANKLRTASGRGGWLALVLSLSALLANYFFRQTPLGESGLLERTLFALLAGWVLYMAAFRIWFPSFRSE